MKYAKLILERIKRDLISFFMPRKEVLLAYLFGSLLKVDLQILMISISQSW